MENISYLQILFGFLSAFVGKAAALILIPEYNAYKIYIWIIKKGSIFKYWFNPQKKNI